MQITLSNLQLQRMMKSILMLNKELLMGSEKGQRKVRLTIGKMSGIINGGVYGCNIPFGFGSLDALPYWETPDDRGLNLWYSEPYGKTYCQTISGVMIFVEGYPQSIFNDVELNGDLYSMAGEVGGIRYLTFDPPMGTWIQRHSNRSKKRVLCRRSSLGGSKC